MQQGDGGLWAVFTSNLTIVGSYWYDWMMWLKYITQYYKEYFSAATV